MKSTFDKLTLVLLLLVIAAAFPAQADSYKGTMTQWGSKREYSFSGGMVTEKGKPVNTGPSARFMDVFCDGEVEAGATVTATGKKIEGKKDKNEVTVEIYCFTTDNKTKKLQKKTGNGSATASAKVPDNATDLRMEITYTGRMGQLRCTVRWKVVKKTSATSGKTQTSTGKYEPFSSNGTVGLMNYSISGGENHPISKIINTGNTVNISCSVGKSKEKINTFCIIRNNGDVVKKAEGAKSTSLSYTIPNNMKGFISAEIGYKVNNKEDYKNTRTFNWNVVNNSNTTETKQEKKSTTNKSLNWDDVGFDLCSECRGQFSDYYVSSYDGNVTFYCYSHPKDNVRKLTSEYGSIEPLYYNDMIVTKNNSKLVLDHGDEDNVLIFYDNCQAHLVKHGANGNDKWDFYSGFIVGKHLKKNNKYGEPEFNMSQCTVVPIGTTYMLQDDGKTSHVYLLDGEAEVTSKKGSKKQTLQPGQVIAVNSKGQMTVDNFDVSATAKKYGITGVSAPKTTKTTNTSKQNTSSNTNSQKTPKTKSTNKKSGKKKSNDVVSNSNSSYSSSSGNVGKYARYGAKRGIVKRVDDGGDIRMYYTTWWDDYGRLERSEITRCEEKVGGKWKSATAPQIINIIIDDKHYMYSKSTGWNQFENTETNWLGSGSKTVSGCKLEKSGTGKVSGKQCDIFKGKRNGTTIEYYIWEGIPMKRVEKDSDGTTTTTVESIELPSSIDSSKFSIPKGAIK